MKKYNIIEFLKLDAGILYFTDTLRLKGKTIELEKQDQDIVYLDDNLTAILKQTFLSGDIEYMTGNTLNMDKQSIYDLKEEAIFWVLEENELLKLKSFIDDALSRSRISRNTKRFMFKI